MDMWAVFLWVTALALVFELPILAFHEWAHMQAARVLGVPVKWVEVGRGRVLARFNLQGVPWTIKAWPGSGSAFIDVQPPYNRREVGLIALAGPYSHFVSGWAMRLAAMWVPGTAGEALDALGWASVLGSVLLLIPHGDNDGALIWRAITDRLG